MTLDNECVGYARECARLAGQIKDTEVRRQLLDMARSWMAEAMHEDGDKIGPTAALCRRAERGTRRLESTRELRNRTGQPAFMLAAGKAL